MRVAVLMGGVSEEREVSLASGVQVARALREAGHEVHAVDTSNGLLTPSQEAALLEAGVKEPPPPSTARDLLLTGDTGTLVRQPGIAETDLVFPILHGGSGEDGTVQTLLEVAGIPFVGSDRVGCALAMDKDLSKRLFRDGSIATPPWILAAGRAEAEDRITEAVETLGLPLIVKPPSGGSTLGLTLGHTADEVQAGVDLSLRYEDRVLFEAYVQGREVTVGILGSEALPVGEIIPEHELFDYECKYKPGMALEVFPADLPEAVARRVQEVALEAHRVLRLRDFSRVDFILDGEGVPWCLEANALPGLTANSLLPKAGLAAGLAFPGLCDRILELGSARYRRGQAR